MCLKVIFLPDTAWRAWSSPLKMAHRLNAGNTKHVVQRQGVQLVKNSQIESYCHATKIRTNNEKGRSERNMVVTKIKETSLEYLDHFCT